ncbi:MAG: tetratricopeptide repeat protein [Thermoproteota archaeon]
MSREEIEKAFNLHELINSMRFFESFLGKKWIQQEVKKRDELHEKDKYFFLCADEDVHPIIKNWPLTSKETNKEKKIYPVQQLSLIAPAHYIQNAKNIKGFNKRVLKTKLRNPNEFEAFVFECKIASAFRRLGYNIEFLPEGSKPTPDFRIRCEGGDVFVECKKKMFTKEEKEYRTRACKVAKEVMHLMDKNQQNLFVEVFSKDAMENIDSVSVVDNLEKQIQSGLKSGNFSIDETRVTWRFLLPFNEEKPGAFNVNLSKEPNYLVNTAEIFIEETSKIKYRNPRVIAFYTEVKFCRGEPLVRKFEDALRQVENHSPSLVYLEVERGTKIQDLEKAEREIEEMFNPSTPNYDERTKGVKYCVFSTIELVEENGTVGEHTFSKGIENRYSKVPLPRSFLILGKYFPGNIDLRFIINEGVKLSENGKHKEAISYYNLALKIAPYIPEGWNNKGNALNHLGRFKEALECLDNALKLNPNYESAYVNKGISLMNLGNVEEALLCFDKAIEINPNFAKAWYNKGLALYRLGRIKESLLCANSALRINPEYEKCKILKEECEKRL